MLPFVLFDDVPQAQAILLSDYFYSDIVSSDDWEKLDDLLQKGWENQLYVAIFADYEWGAKWHQQDLPYSGELRLFWFKNKKILNQIDLHDWLSSQTTQGVSGIIEPKLNIESNAYQKQIERIHADIARGDVYQINYTIRLHIETYGSPIDLYRRLRPRVPYAVLAYLPEMANEWTLCFSPELFLKINENGIIQTEPMKGTAPILHDGKDAERAHFLRHDPKNLAENTMIVDLLRNDLGKISQIGGISVPEPFKISDFGTVWQMTSTVQAHVLPQTSFAQIMRATFPCGSITGAPKRMSIQKIFELEGNSRGLYTGSIGFLEAKPQHYLGFSGCLNVAIRTLQLHQNNPKNHFYSGVYGVGSGIVIDSQASDEFTECHWKTRFLRELRPEFDLFETMRVENGQIDFWETHLARLCDSAKKLNFIFNELEIKTRVQTTLQSLPKQEHYRFKLILKPTGECETEIAPLSPLVGKQSVLISPKVLPNQDFLRKHKTTYRADYDQAWQWAQTQGAFDAVFFNEDGFLLEGGRSSVMILLNNQCLAPSLDLDILPSVARTQALKHNSSIQETMITREMFENAEKILLGNALRGWFEVELKI